MRAPHLIRSDLSRGTGSRAWEASRRAWKLGEDSRCCEPVLFTGAHQGLSANEDNRGSSRATHTFREPPSEVRNHTADSRVLGPPVPSLSRSASPLQVSVAPGRYSERTCRCCEAREGSAAVAGPG